MKPIAKTDILSFQDWERVRARLRPLFIHEKEYRRLSVGAHLTFLFENAQTVWYQIHEMIRTERITDAAAIQAEIDTYNELIPGLGELSATMLIEYADTGERDSALGRLVGLERHLWIKIGDRKNAVTFDARQMSSNAISAVQFVRIPIAPVTADEFEKSCSEGRVSIEVDHPSFGAQGHITGALARYLVEDLRAA